MTRPTQKRFFEVGLFLFYRSNDLLQFFRLQPICFFSLDEESFLSLMPVIGLVMKRHMPPMR